MKKRESQTAQEVWHQVLIESYDEIARLKKENRALRRVARAAKALADAGWPNYGPTAKRLEDGIVALKGKR